MTALATVLVWSYSLNFLLLLAFSSWFTVRLYSRLRRANEVLCRGLFLDKATLLDVTLDLDHGKAASEHLPSATTPAREPPDRLRWMPNWMRRRPAPSASNTTKPS